MARIRSVHGGVKRDQFPNLETLAIFTNAFWRGTPGRNSPQRQCHGEVETKAGRGLAPAFSTPGRHQKAIHGFVFLKSPGV